MAAPRALNASAEVRFLAPHPFVIPRLKQTKHQIATLVQVGEGPTGISTSWGVRAHSAVLEIAGLGSTPRLPSFAAKPIGEAAGPYPAVGGSTPPAATIHRALVHR